MPSTPDQDDNEKSMDLGSDQDTHSSDQHLVIYDPDEKFEWLEVKRGTTTLLYISKLFIDVPQGSWTFKRG